MRERQRLLEVAANSCVLKTTSNVLTLTVHFSLEEDYEINIQ